MNQGQSVEAALITTSNSTFTSSLGPEEQQALLDAEKKALDFSPAGQAVNWGTRNGAATGSVTASDPFQVGRSNCRRLSYQLTSSGTTSKANLTACQKPGAPWALVS